MKRRLVLFLLIAAGLISAAELGPVCVDDGVIFRFRDTSAKTVSVAGEFNGWDKSKHVMTLDEEQNLFWIKILLEEGEFAYKFVIDDSKWVIDENSPKYADDGYGGRNSVVVVKYPVKIKKESAAEKAEPTMEVTTVEGRTVVFRYKSPSVESVSVAGAFNGWHPGKNFLRDEDGDGVWELKMFLPEGRYTYFFVINVKE
ncbi:MAG: hypothetical protein PHQ23_09820, partial [Candidatus Wallbacteria bacterium]|nr:hypothetical protein [Candidatus Wallbacteria bacterium]